MNVKRVFIIVLDSVGAGELPDAEKFGDKGTNTLKSIHKSPFFEIPNLMKMGLGEIQGLEFLKNSAPDDSRKKLAAVGKIAEISNGKDTTIGHWEIMGLVSEEPLPTYPDGFPKEIIDKFSNLTGRGILCNKPYSGTEVIADYGEAHIKTGDLIVYTSADSVFQIAAHEEVVPVETLYGYCRIARKLLTGKHSVGRVIARPFIGENGNFTRTSNRHDFSLEPTGETLLDVMKANGFDTIGVGKINDIFASRGITEFVTTKGNEDGMDKTLEYVEKDFNGLCFVNLVDFDSVYGHRNNIDGYAAALTDFDFRLGELLPKLRDDDILIITADHGCDPGDISTDHTREYVPLIVYGKFVKPVNLGVRRSFADVAATIAEWFSVAFETAGESFAGEIS
ncbi:MAG: phosphopentomutase [Ruminococcaceae bacterium]|nr:phosphopentomutase [Oscillospiraceae bacterium]